jgi:hypothetical protein
VLHGAAQAELQAPQAVGQQVAAALQQFALGQQLLPQPVPQPSHEAQPFPHGAAQLLQPPQGAAQLGAGQQWLLLPQQPPRLRRVRQRASASLERETTNNAARADNANSFRIMMWDSYDSAI